MKAWVLADSLNGYVWGWKLYTGKEGRDSGQGLAHRVVVDLLADPRPEGKGHLIYTDNFYSSPALFKELTKKGFGACGTVRRDRRGIPVVVRETKLRRGEVVSSMDNGVLALKWHDKRDVLMISTFHDTSMTLRSRRSRAAEGGVENVEKPVVIENYNQHMGGVDRGKLLCKIKIINETELMKISHFMIIGDQMVLYYGFFHRSLKWWKRVFFHLLDVTLVNSHILYNISSGSKTTHLDFRLSVAKGLLQGLEQPRPRRSASSDLPLRLTERPFPEPVPDGKRPDCAVCSNRGARKRHQTGYRCKLCHTPPCLYPCFERYHTLKDYKLKY